MTIQTPWPAVRPAVPPLMHGWFVPENAEMLSRHLSPAARCIIEVGSWYGASARWFCEYAPAAHVYCIDPWEPYPEILSNPEWAALQPGAYAHFVDNLWEFRDRVHIIRWRTPQGLWACYKHLGLKPDLIYVDGDHTAAAVQADVNMSLRSFPGAAVVGDDWGRESVRAGVYEAIGYEPAPVNLENNGVCWAIGVANRGAAV